MDADLRSRMVAYHSAAPDGPPGAWTPEQVVKRYTEALRIVGRLPQMRVGGGGGGWPSLLMDMAKAVDAEARRMLHEKALDAAEIARADEIEPSVRFASDGPTPDQISRAEEAIAWPLVYLSEWPKGSDALTIFCYGRAFKSFELLPFLKERMRQAEILAKREADDLNNRHPAYAKARKRRHEIAKEVNQILNGWLATAEDLEHATIMKREAILLLRNWCAEAGVLPVPPRPPHEVCPDLVLARTTLDRLRKRAAAIISQGLQRDRVPVR